MNQRSSLAVFCMVSALVGGIVATQSVGRDRATAQVATTNAPIVEQFLTNFVRCPWQYWNGIVTSTNRVQVVAPGASGVVHGYYTSSNVELHEGLVNVDARIHRQLGAAPSQFAQLDTQFTDGLKIVGIDQGGAVVTVLYRIDSAPNTATEK